MLGWGGRLSGIIMGCMLIWPEGILHTSEAQSQVSENRISKVVKKKWDFQNLTTEALNKDWIRFSGKWSIENEPEHPANRVLYQSQSQRQMQLLLTKKPYTNFECSIRFRADTFDQKPRNWQMGLIFRRADKNHYYKLRITAANIGLIRFAGFQSDILPGCESRTRVAAATGQSSRAGEQVLMILPIGAPADKWHTLGLSCWGDRIRIKLNGREIRTLTDVGVGSGQIGLFTYKTKAWLDDFQLAYYTMPKLTKGILPVQNEYWMRKQPGLLVYYANPGLGELQLNVLDPRGKIFTQLVKGMHSKGLHSTVWDGHGVTGERAGDGVYTLELRRGSQRHTARITVHP